MSDDPLASVHIDGIDPLLESDADRARLVAELEHNLPLLIEAVGAGTFVMFCKQLVDIANRVKAGEGFMVEKNTHRDGAFLYIGTHTFDVVAELRKKAGLTPALVLKAKDDAIADVRARRAKDNN